MKIHNYDLNESFSWNENYTSLDRLIKVAFKKIYII